MKKILFTILFVISGKAFSYTQQTARILELYVHQSGHIALKFEGGFSNLVKAECEGNNDYAGTRTADNMLKSFILAQYAAGREVKLGFSGCDGTWIKIVDVRGFK